MHVVRVTRRSLVRAVAALVTAGFGIWLAAPTASATAMAVEVGTWTRNPAPPPPPEGGLAVANSIDGPVTISAIRFQVDDGNGTVLRLQQVDAVAPAGAAVQACVTTSTWAPAVNGEFASAPEAACDLGAVALAAQPDGSWSADITRLLSASDSIVLLPAPQAPAVFSLSFEPPAVETTTPSPPTTQQPASDPPASSPSSAGDTFGGVEPGGSFSSRPSELAVPPAEVPEVTPSPVVAPAAGNIGAAQAFVATTPGDHRSGRDVGQALRLGLLSLAVGAASVPILRLKDGAHVPVLSGVVGVVQRRSTSRDPSSTTGSAS